MPSVHSNNLVSTEQETPPAVLRRKHPAIRRMPRAIAAIALGLLALVAYGAGLDNSLVSDDWYVIYFSSRAADPWALLTQTSFGQGWFSRPLELLLTFMLFSVFGTNPLPYHALSLVLHLLNAALLAAFTRQLWAIAGFPSGWLRGAAPYLAAGIFLVNARHHEAVFWFASINEPLALFGQLAALNLVAYWLHGRRHYPLVLLATSVAVAFALSAKESAAVTPVALAAVTALFAATRGLRAIRCRHALLLLACQFALAGGYLYAYVATGTGRDSGLKVSGLLSYGWLVRLARHLAAAYIPGELTTAGIPGELAAAGPLILLLIILALGILGLLALRYRLLWAFALLWTLLLAAPYAATVGAMSGEPLETMGVGADRYLYSVSAAASLLAVASLAWLDQARALRPVAVPLAAIILLAFLITNVSRLRADEADWDSAGRQGDALMRQVVNQLSPPAAGDDVCLINWPDNYRNKYVYRNGGPMRMWLSYGRAFGVRELRSPASSDLSGCTIMLTYREQGNSIVIARSQRS